MEYASRGDSTNGVQPLLCRAEREPDLKKRNYAGRVCYCRASPIQAGVRGGTMH